MEEGISSEELDRLLNAMIVVGSGLDLQVTLRRIVEAAIDLVRARYGALGVLDPAGAALEDFITVGLTDEQRERIGRLPEGHGVLGLIITGEKPVRIDDLSAHPASYGFPPHHPPMRSLLGVPIRVRDRVFGDLYLTEKLGPDGEPADGFTEHDEQLVVALAAAAAVAIENSRLHDRISRLALAEDRSRIARDLHDTVIQRIFAIGLSLQGAQAILEGEPDVAHQRLADAVDDLDRTVKHIRSVIFGLQSADRSGSSFRDQVLVLAHEATGALGFRAAVAFDGPVDAVLAADARRASTSDADLASDVLAVIQEGLANAARHAQASRVDVAVQVSGDRVVVSVRDDGVGGVLARPGGRGLQNLRARAARHDGTCIFEDTPEGTEVRWQAPLG